MTPLRVRCDTHHEYTYMLQHLEARGFVWASGDPPTSKDYYVAKSNCVIDVKASDKNIRMIGNGGLSHVISVYDYQQLIRADAFMRPVTNTVVMCYNEEEWKRLTLALFIDCIGWGQGMHPWDYIKWADVYAAQDGRGINVSDYTHMTHGQRGDYGPAYDFPNIGMWFKHWELRRDQTQSCPDCKGTKIYVGLMFEEPCRTCCAKPTPSQAVDAQ